MLPSYITEFVVLAALFLLARILRRGLAPHWWRSTGFAEGVTNAQFFFFDALLVLPLVVLVSVGIASSVPSLIQIQRYDIPMALEFALVVLCSDLVGYWRHRILHTRHLWPSHAVHHSDQHVHWLTLIRIHPVERFVNVAFDSTLLTLIGVDPALTVANNLLRHYYGYLLHVDIPWTLGPLRYVFVTPHLHRWHHATDEAARDKNFAVIFAFIDLAFGTFYCPRHSPAQTGLGEGSPRMSFVHGLAYPFQQWARAFRS